MTNDSKINLNSKDVEEFMDKIFGFLKDTFVISDADKEFVEELVVKLQKRYKPGKDPWGLDLELCGKLLKVLVPFYRNYFKVRVFGKENVGKKPYMVVSNHSGQVAIDGLLLQMAFALEVDPPRILRGMVDRTMSTFPFFGQIATAAGSVLGDRKNCEYLLKRGESILVFPEGVKGIAKNTPDFYKMQTFTKGFFRLALANHVDILPIATVGAEEFYPIVHHMKGLAKALKLPAFPLTPLFPWLGPLGLIPLPSPVDIYIGTPYSIPKGMSPDALDNIVEKHIVNIKNDIKAMMNDGLKNRREFTLLDKLGIKVKREL